MVKFALTFISMLISGILFNTFATQIDDLNAKMRNFLINGDINNKKFTQDGLPVYSSPRIGEYTSPFYVIHYGLEHTSKCSQYNVSKKFHWRPDQTLAAWHESGITPSKDLLKKYADWVIENIKYDKRGNAHLFYNFDWPYEKFALGKLSSPWWSGLTDGHAITFMLRAYDCFADERYLRAATDLYASVTKPLSEGGSLSYLNGLPWIEEYIDRFVTIDTQTSVFNGMAYAYFGIKSFEEFKNFEGIASDLRTSIIKNAHVFGKGCCWSYYDNVYESSNIKYHRVNLLLLKDDRLYDESLNDLMTKLEIGDKLTVPFYFMYGPRTYALYHNLLTFIFLNLVTYFGLRRVFIR